MKKQIVWIADVPGWAYDNRAKQIASRLSDYSHLIIYDIVKNWEKAMPLVAGADIVVCPDPRILNMLPFKKRVLQHVNAIKIF
jgi:hypothetical protein